MIQISIVVLNWNGARDTIECLKSLKKLQISNFKLQIIVVDNGSADESVRLIRRRYKNVVVVENKKNLGFAGGNNVGMRHAVENGADFVMILNNDTTVKDSLLIEFLESADRHNDAGVLSPKIFFSPGYEFHKERYTKGDRGHIIWYAGGVIDWENVLASNYGVDDTDIGQYTKEHEIDFATGACMFIRREVLERVGYFDEKYFLYLEDADFSQRVKQTGWEIIFIPNAHVWHKVSQSSSIGGDLNDYFITRNRLLFGIRWAPIRSKLALLKESVKLLYSGRPWQKRGVKDFYLGKFGKGTWQ